MLTKVGILVLRREYDSNLSLEYSKELVAAYYPTLLDQIGQKSHILTVYLTPSVEIISYIIHILNRR